VPVEAERGLAHELERDRLQCERARVHACRAQERAGSRRPAIGRQGCDEAEHDRRHADHDQDRRTVGMARLAQREGERELRAGDPAQRVDEPERHDDAEWDGEDLGEPPEGSAGVHARAPSR
jgi:hypothetical protein